MPKGRSKTDDHIKQIGDKLKEMRIDAGYTSYETFANDFELDRKQYWRVEAGTNITLRTLIKVLEVHELSLKDFFNDTRFKK
jgi:hypothetical protein